MKVKDLIYFGEMAIRKFEGHPEFKEQIDEMKENIRQIKLLHPNKLTEELSESRRKKVIRYYKKLGIKLVEITPDINLAPVIDDKDGLIREMNKIANELM